MNFAIRNLSVLAYAQGFTLWHYRTGANGLASASRPGFFDDAADMLNGGDMVLVSSPDGGRILCVAATRGQVVTAALA
ncbi:MAG TPA: hypothetical protein VHS58_15520 [Acetobacteraceae bacterium]|jgi:hypothetical protein|nr:hypothetical protein [Acetobacteraceae bacterium]